MSCKRIHVFFVFFLILQGFVQLSFPKFSRGEGEGGEEAVMLKPSISAEMAKRCGRTDRKIASKRLKKIHFTAFLASSVSPQGNLDLGAIQRHVVVLDSGLELETWCGH